MKLSGTFTTEIQIDIDTDHPDFERDFRDEFGNDEREVIIYILDYESVHAVSTATRQFAWIKDISVLESDLEYETIS